MGYSENTGDPKGNTAIQRWDAQLGRSLPATPYVTGLWVGFKMYDGPVMVSGLVARAFPPGTTPIGVRAASREIGESLLLNAWVGHFGDGGAFWYACLHQPAACRHDPALQVRSYNSFQMAGLSSIQGFKPEGCTYRFANPVSQPGIRLHLTEVMLTNHRDA